MSANRLRIAFSLIATIVVALSPSAIGRGQETLPPVADPAASPAASDPPATASDPAATPTASKRPLVRKGDGWHPIVIVPANGEDFDDMIVKLNAAGFDAIRAPDSNWIGVAPRPNQTEAESVPQLRALLGEDALSALPGTPPGNGPRKTDSPHSFTCVKWTPQASGDEAQKADLNRVVTALADSGLPFEIIDHDQRRDGSNYIFAIHAADADAEVEALIRRLVENPTLWPAQSINVQSKPVPDATLPAVPATLDPPALATDAAPAAPPIERDRPTVIREGSVGNTTHPFLVDLPDDDTDYAALERTLEGEGFDVLTFDFKKGPTSMRIAPPSGVDLKTAGRRLAEVLGSQAEIHDELSSVPPQVAFMADLLSTRHWFFKWKGDDESDRDRVLKALADSDVAIAELTWSRDPDGSWQVAIDSSPLDVDKIEGLIKTLVKEPKIWRPIGSSQGNEAKALPAPDSDAAESAATPPVDPETVAEESSDAKPADPAATPAEKAEAPKFQAKILLIETDWEKANDRAAASRLGNAVSNRIFEMNRAGTEVFPPGYAADFPGDEALTVSEELQRLGLVRQSLAFSSLDLGLSEQGVEALGTVQVTFMETKSDGKRESVVWNVLVVTQALPDPPPSGDPFAGPADPSAEPVRTYCVGVVGWKDRTAAKRNATDEAAANSASSLPPPLEVAPPDSDESARYVGSFFLPTDQSAIVPLALPGLEGAAIVVSRDQKRSAVRSLGPLSGAATLQALTTRFPVDWDDLIRAYEASPLGVAGTQARTVEAMQGASESAEENAEMTLFWRPAQEDQIDLVANALKQRYPKLEIGLKQMQGAQGATLVFAAPASTAEAIQAIAAQTLPEGATVQVGVSKGAVEKPEEARTTLIFRLENSASDDVVKLLDALKLDPGIRVVSDARTNTIILSAPDATKHKHVQAMIDLLKELDRPADANPASPKNAAQPQPDRTASVANLRSELARIESDVQTIAANARSTSAPERSTKIDELRRAVAAAFDLRLKLQREEAAELRDRLAKIEQNLSRRERIEGAVIERRIDVLLDPALEWPEVADEESSPLPAVAGSSAGNVSTESPALDLIDIDSTFGEQSVSQPSDRGDAFAAATSIASEMDELTEEANALSSDDPKGAARRATLRRRLDLLRQEFDARQQALKIDLQTAQAKAEAAQTALSIHQARYQSARGTMAEVVDAQAELKAAHAEVARLELLLQQYDRVRASLPDIDVAASGESSGTPSAEPGSEDVAATSQGDPSADESAADRALAAPGDAFSAATALATKIGRLTSEKQAYQRQGASDASPLVANIDRELDLLRLEFEARNQALKMELGALKSKLAGVRVRYDQTRKLIGQGVVSQQEGQLVEAEMNAAQADLARQEVLLQQYDRARASLPSEDSESASVPPELQGTWRLTKSVLDGLPSGSPSFTKWMFDETTLNTDSSIADSYTGPYRVEFLSDAPGCFRIYDSRQGEAMRRQVRFRLEGETLKVASAQADRPPESVAPAEGVNYYEFERVTDAAAAADDESVPGQSGPTPPAAASPEDAEAQAERAAATALALRAADLYLEIRRIEAQNPAPPHRNLAVSLLKEQVDRLRERLEDRRAEVRKERAAAAVKLAVVQTRLDRVRRLASPNDGASQDLSTTQAELASATAALANIDASLAAFDAAAEAFDAAAKSQALPPDFADDADGQALKKLQGFWVSTEKNISSDFGTFSPEYASVWLVAGKTMLWLGFVSDDGSLYDVTTEAGEEPARLTLIFEGTPQRPASIHACAFRFDGDALLVADRRNPSLDLVDVAPQPGVSYYRFERYEALEPGLASFDFDAVDVDAIRKEGIDVPTGSERVPFPLRRSQAGSFPKSLASARTQLRELAIAIVKSREASESSRDPALSAEEYQRLRSQAFSQRAECFRHREQFFAERFYVEQALASVRARIESAPSGKEREELESTQAKLAECLTEIDRLAGVARLPAPVALGPATDEAWHPFVNFGQSIRPDLSLKDHAEALRQAEAKLAALGPDDPGRQEAIERRDYLLDGARRLRDRWRESSTNAEGRADETRAALGKAKRAVDAMGQKMDAAEREVAVTREEYQLERDAEIIRECSRQLAELESAFPTLAADSDSGESQPSDSSAPAR